ncbi:MAG TPA: hypothetical protein VL588_02900 [Bdellovibrionota bacterium]|nr:hypothetical protein [Bdellovibrionota bacterium]
MDGGLLGGWIPLVEYAVKNGVSLSTLRRHIKAEKIRFQRVNGRYLLWDDEQGVPAALTAATAPPPPAKRTDAVQMQGDGLTRLVARVERLERDLMKAQEEIAELKMLVALYEERMPEKLDN